VTAAQGRLSATSGAPHRAERQRRTRQVGLADFNRLRAG
jgi:hypothetical protein